MLRQIWIAECDLCGKIVRARSTSDGYHDTYDLPDGWGYGHNKDFTLCPECIAARSTYTEIEGGRA